MGFWNDLFAALARVSAGVPQETDDADTWAPPVRLHGSSAPEHIGFGAIRHADPAFDLDTFYARVAEMFQAYHAALAKNDLAPARRFIDERYYRELADRMKSQEASIPSAVPEPEHARAMTARHEEGMDTVRVMITAAYPGQARGSQKLQEYWTLIRRAGAQTKAGLSAYKCPNCGAPTDGDDPTRCSYCGARLADPALDWVVSRIDLD
ncbi:MAG TPA: zinc-ribbon domain-containing transport protein [Coriobacteriia bacterium]|jgi:predicted lipid-binding transport protein (Tim44 family)